MSGTATEEVLPSPGARAQNTVSGGGSCAPSVRWRGRDEGAGRGQAGHRLQRQDPRQGGQDRGRDRQRQDVDEPVRRDRCRRGAQAARGRHHRGGDRGLAGGGAVPGDHPHGTGDGCGSRRAGRDHCRTAAARRRQAVESGHPPGKPGDRDHRQAGDRRRLQSDRPDAVGLARLAAGDLRLEAQDQRRARRGDARGRWRARDGRDQIAGGDHHRSAAQRAALCLLAEHHEGEKEADRDDDARGARCRCDAAPRRAQGRGAAEAPGRPQGGLSRRARRQAQDRGAGDLMAALVVAEHDNAALKPATLNAVAAAKEIAGQDIDILVAGKGCHAVAEAAGEVAGIRKVLLADDAAYDHGLAENVAPLVVKLAENYSHLLAPATTSGKNLMPRVAALLDVMQISDISGVVSPDTFVRPIYAGNALATVQSIDPTKVITVRGTAFPPGEATGGSAAIEPVPSTGAAGLSEFLRAELSKSERPELTSARIIISGGRGMQSGDNFHLLEKVADKLGGAVGASRAAVDAGFVPNDYQVGQTGKIVAPELYVAVGISGAIQHLAGMKDSKVIVAINKDEEAPIFQVADYGLVGDLFKILPELDAELERRQ